MDIDESMTAEQMLKEVNNAICTVLVGGQSYKIGSRQLTRADLKELRQLKTELEQESRSESDDGLLDNSYVAYFDGR